MNVLALQAEVLWRAFNEEQSQIIRTYSISNSKSNTQSPN